MLKERNYQPIIISVAKMSFKSEGEIKIFPDKQKLRESVINTPVLQEMLKGILHSEMKGQ